VLTLSPEATSTHTPLETTVAGAEAEDHLIPGHFVQEAEDHLVVVSPLVAPSLTDLYARSAIVMVILL
jgi:hypothetical protein